MGETELGAQPLSGASKDRLPLDAQLRWRRERKVAGQPMGVKVVQEVAPSQLKVLTGPEAITNLNVVARTMRRLTACGVHLGSPDGSPAYRVDFVAPAHVLRCSRALDVCFSLCVSAKSNERRLVYDNHVEERDHTHVLTWRN
jgi:hypothetical protein